MLPVRVLSTGQSESLDPSFKKWLEEVDLLLSEEEREYFLSLDENYRRSAFIDAFWAARDSHDDTVFNEFKVRYEDRLDQAVGEFGTFDDARVRVWLIQGEPHDRCWHRSKEVEVWSYDEAGKDKILRGGDVYFPVLLYQPTWEDHYLQWLPVGAEVRSRNLVGSPSFFQPASRTRVASAPVLDWCGDSAAEGAMALIEARLRLQGRAEPKTFATLQLPDPSIEWVEAFHARSTILPEDGEVFAVDLDFTFPGRYQQRTVVQTLVEIDRDQLGYFKGVEEDHHQILLQGDVVREDELFESFRYRFEVPAERTSSEPLALAFQRYLRPGEFRLVLKLEDLYGRRFASMDTELQVPKAVDLASAEFLSKVRRESQIYQALAEARTAASRGEHRLHLLEPPRVVVTGMVRLQTITAGRFERVVFLLDDQPILSKRSPPYSVELDLGNLPSAHRLRVTGYGEGEQILASDEILLNPGGQRFRVALTEPQRGGRYRQSLRAAVQVAVPDGDELDRIEIFLDETRVATLYQEPFVQPIQIQGEELAYVRAVGYLKDGNSSEDLTFINAPGEIEHIDVQFVDLLVTVRDRQGRFISDLNEQDFRVEEDGELQNARRFEWVEDLPLHIGLMIDVSASMKESLEDVAKAAQTFVQEVVQPKDRAAVITFNHQPEVRARFTNEHATLRRELESMRSSGGTALYDSLAYALHYFHGIEGQKALILLSDGEDEASRFDFEDALEFARRAGVQIYPIGLDETVKESRARRLLKRIAKETGGRAFFVANSSSLPEIYAEIQGDLRSQYLFAYQSTSKKKPSEFRAIEVEVRVHDQKAEVRAMSGYYP